MLLGALAAPFATPAMAQPGLVASLTSDYLYRGYSLSAGRPALVATLSYDHPLGAYASASVVAADRRHCVEVLDACERLLEGHPEVDVLSAHRSFYDDDD